MKVGTSGRHVALENGGRVIEAHLDRYVVRFDGRDRDCKVSGKFRHGAKEKADFPVVGDWVELKHIDEKTSLIERVLPRTTQFVRRDDRGHRKSKGSRKEVLASNYDLVLIVMSMNADFNPRRLERYLSTAYQGGGEVYLLLSKADLVSSEEDFLEKTQGLMPRQQVIPFSAVTGKGMERILEVLGPNTTAVLLGSSGVGKSTLVNALGGTLAMKTGGIRESDAKGRHTTTHRQLIELEDGRALIDTPGLRELRLGGAEEGLEDAFSDIQSLAESCRFGNCSHTSEPGCAVQEAVQSGKLDSKRLKSYIKLKNDQ